MLLPEKKILLIHVPKTAGTFLEKWLMPHSDAEIVVGGWRDPEERFEIKGKYTRHKHMTLDQYRLALEPEAFNKLHILSAARHPVQRSVSFYFSPHRWVMKKRSARIRDKVLSMFGHNRSESSKDFTTARPLFSLEKFEEVLADMPSMSSYLKLNGSFKAPDFLIRHETFEEDCRKFANRCEITAPEFSRKVNKSTISREQFDEISSDRRVIELIRDRYAEDFANFGYE